MEHIQKRIQPLRIEASIAEGTQVVGLNEIPKPTLLRQHTRLAAPV